MIKRMFSILMITTNFWPEPTGTGPYATDIVKLLNSNDYSIHVLTGIPHYPWWQIPIDYMKNPSNYNIYNGIDIVREKHYVPRRLNVLTRFLFEISLVRSLRRGFTRINSANIDLVLVIGSSLAGGLVAKSISKKLNTPYGIVVHDLAGQGARQSGISGGSLVAKLVARVERLILSSSKGIVAISQMMKDVVLDMGIEDSKVNTILIYAANPVTPIDKTIARSKFDWAKDEFVVVHTGNMGAKQDLENVVRAANELKDNSRVKIYLVGHGNRESNLKAMCEGKKNIFIKAAVSDDDYSALLSAADLLIVNERSTQMEMSLPSKLTSYLYSNRPVLAAVPRGGATWKFLDGVAELVEAGNPRLLAQKIEELSNDPERLTQLAALGAKFAKENLDPEVGRAKYLTWVKDLLSAK